MNVDPKTLRVLVSPDKFKGSMTGPEAARAIADGVRDAFPNADMRLVPIADGGEGTVDAVLAVGGTAHTETVTGPLGDPVRATWATIGSTAVIEIAAASGLALVTPDDNSARRADTSGTGQLIRRALDEGCKEIVLGLGGSATTDGGAGILRVLGARLLDAQNRPLSRGGEDLTRLVSLDLGGLDPRLAVVPLRLCCDVSSPLLGPSGAAAIFAPQKGAKPETVKLLEGGLKRLAQLLTEETGRNAAKMTWGGAAGGTAGGMYGALNASFAPGIDAVAELLELDKHLDWADLLIVGEGSLDVQSLAGKAPIGAARRAASRGVPSIAVAGLVSLSEREFAKEGILAAVSLVDTAGSSEAALDRPTFWTRSAAKSLMLSLSRTIAERLPTAS